ncbi:methyl-accepting chemotaxis protein [Alteromonadaceae bacterium BrNp21-10]|nr:methyl-accepting chemotaxis protein [Alteromonadaceae bacterium BrNp21-10]
MFVTKQRFLQLQQSYDALQKELAEVSSEKNAAMEHIETLEQNAEVKKRLVLQDVVWESLLSCLNQVSEVRQSVSASYDAMQNESASVEDVSSVFSESSDSLEKMTKSMQSVTTDMQGMSVSISSLKDIADSIFTFVNTISKISDQTNLLALNAAIEAARAGEAGRGFSVVADEVRALATNTNESAEEVGGLVQKIKVDTDTSVSSVTALQEANGELTQSISMLNESYHRVSGFCESMKNAICNATDNGLLQTVKLDHIVWKTEVYEAALGRSNLTKDQLLNHNECRLGQWYQGEGKNRYAGNAGFRNLEEPHKRMHAEGVSALAAIEKDDVEQAMAHLHAMEEASSEVMRQLDSI